MHKINYRLLFLLDFTLFFLLIFSLRTILTLFELVWLNFPSTFNFNSCHNYHVKCDAIDRWLPLRFLALKDNCIVLSYRLGTMFVSLSLCISFYSPSPFSTHSLFLTIFISISFLVSFSLFLSFSLFFSFSDFFPFFLLVFSLFFYLFLTLW